ncbi:hypothetical protein H4219_003998 [Mycoemilia scoparia]|uniref:Uncharacterized protein n=1 Tax=Mycoemilia scoparia TaxID=417184 RepID=A0A9W7ZXG6_9FUNG|nr:hypothetical protein H4219_003998 [Mycoemilia scoparia]
MTKSTFIDNILVPVNSLQSSGEQINDQNLPCPKLFIEQILGFELRSLEIDKSKVETIEPNYETYRSMIELVESIKNATTMLSIIHPNESAREFFDNLHIYIKDALYSGDAMKNSITTLYDFVYDVEVDNDNKHSLEESLKKVLVFFKIFGLYNINENESDRKQAWLEAHKLIDYTDYIKTINDLNLRANCCYYHDHFDYILANSVLQERHGFMDEVDRMIKSMMPQYNRLLNTISTTTSIQSSQEAAVSPQLANPETTPPKIKFWNFSYLLDKFQNNDDNFRLAKMVKNGTYTLSKVINAAINIFTSSTGYDIRVDNRPEHLVWASNVVKYNVTYKDSDENSSGDPQMVIYMDIYKNNRQQFCHFEYIHQSNNNNNSSSSSDSNGVPCIIMYLPLINDNNAQPESKDIRFGDVQTIFKMFGKAAYYTVFQPNFLPSHRQIPPDTRVTENPDFQIEFFKQIFASTAYEPNVLKNIISSTHQLTMISPNSNNAAFEHASKQLKYLERKDSIINGMKGLVAWKFAEYMYSEVYSADVPKEKLCKAYHDLCSEYLSLEYDDYGGGSGVLDNDSKWENITTPFTENTGFLQLRYLPSYHFGLCAKLVHANIYCKIQQHIQLQSTSSNSSSDMVGMLMEFMLNLCNNIISSRNHEENNGGGELDKSFSTQLTTLLQSCIDLNIFEKYNF